MSRFYPVETPPTDSYKIVRVKGGHKSGQRKGAVFHAVMLDNKEGHHQHGRALCAALPADWSDEVGKEVTCKTCASRLGLIRSRTEWDPVHQDEEHGADMEPSEKERMLMLRRPEEFQRAYYRLRDALRWARTLAEERFRDHPWTPAEEIEIARLLLEETQRQRALAGPEDADAV
jgi:hypothetical protein